MNSVILTDRPSTPSLPKGKCPCGKEKFQPVLGGKEVCMECGHERESA